MTTELEIGLYIFMLAGFLGYHVITRVPPLLHTPLMSATNAISGISLIGSLVVAGADYGPVSTILGFVAVSASSTNVVGGFLITDRMLKMFKSERDLREGSSLGRKLAVILGIALVLVAIGYYLRSQATATHVSFRELFSNTVLRYSYIVSAALFILGLKGLSSPKHARTGMFLAEGGMALAIIGTLFHSHIVTYKWIGLGLAIGTVVGGAMGLKIPMTAVPQRTALSHSLGALAAALIGIAEFYRHSALHELERVKMTTIGLEVIIGALTVTGSLVAAGKLQAVLPERPITYKGQNAANFTLLGVILLILIYLILFVPPGSMLFYVMVGLAFLFGIALVTPIGAADMPTVIALLNSYGGLADAMMGFVLMNKIQIITGSLDGTSGFLLSLLMCRAMNRSPANVLFGAFGKVDEQAPVTDAKGTVRSITPEEFAELIDSVRSVIVVPGYGMAVAQAQHVVSELGTYLRQKGIDVKYAIHPVAGRMPGHMNVLLAEANVPYDQLYAMEQVNPYFPQADVALVIGANDVTNPAAKHNKSSPLYGMPILEVDRAKSIIVCKRSMRPGFAGVDNELYFDPKCMMLFGDAKDSIGKLYSTLKAA